MSRARPNKGGQGFFRFFFHGVTNRILTSTMNGRGIGRATIVSSRRGQLVQSVFLSSGDRLGANRFRGRFGSPLSGAREASIAHV